MRDRARLGRLTVRGALRVPEITVYFWVIKALSTAMGESTSDFLLAGGGRGGRVRHDGGGRPARPFPRGVCGLERALRDRIGRGVCQLGKTEKTLSFHTIDTPRREAFYWGAVVATFAMGTAVGDLTATTFGLGYFASGLVFAGVVAVPALGYRWLGWNAILSFWFAYVATRALGASFADWLGRPESVKGLGWGDGRVAPALAFMIFCLVAYLAITHRDVQGVGREGAAGDGRFRANEASAETID